MIEVGIDPCFDIFELTKIDDEAVCVELMAAKSQGDGPVMPMNQSAMSVVFVLPVCEWNIAIRFLTGEHGLNVG